jgi:hypothetical protein
VRTHKRNLDKIEEAKKAIDELKNKCDVFAKKKIELATALSTPDETFDQ